MLRNARYLSARETKYSFVKLEQIFHFNHEQEGLDLEMKLAWRRVSECPRLQTLCKNLTTLNQTLIAEGDCDIIREGVKSIKKVFMESVCKGGSLSPSLPSSFKRMCNNVKTMSREDFKYGLIVWITSLLRFLQCIGLDWWNIRNWIWIICHRVDRFNTAYVSSLSNVFFCRHLKELEIFSRLTNVSLFHFHDTTPHITDHISHITDCFDFQANQSQIQFSGHLVVLISLWFNKCWRDLSISGCTHAHGFYRFCRAIEWNLEACSPLWLHIWIQMCLSQVVNFLCTQLWVKKWKIKKMLNFSSLAKGNFDKLTQVCFGGVSKFQSQYIWFTRAKRLCIASKQEIKRSLIVEFDNFRSQGDPRSCNRACKWLKYHPALKDHRLVKLWTRQLTRYILWFESDNGKKIRAKNQMCFLSSSERFEARARSAQLLSPSPRPPSSCCLSTAAL